jgi:hypothetical protein
MTLRTWLGTNAHKGVVMEAFQMIETVIEEPYKRLTVRLHPTPVALDESLVTIFMEDKDSGDIQEAQFELGDFMKFINRIAIIKDNVLPY